MVRSPSRTLSSDVISTGTWTQFGGGDVGALRSKPTMPSKRPANRLITASPILPLEPLTMMIPAPGVIAFPLILVTEASPHSPPVLSAFPVLA